MILFQYIWDTIAPVLASIGRFQEMRGQTGDDCKHIMSGESLPHYANKILLFQIHL